MAYSCAETENVLFMFSTVKQNFIQPLVSVELSPKIVPLTLWKPNLEMSWFGLPSVGWGFGLFLLLTKQQATFSSS